MGLRKTTDPQKYPSPGKPWDACVDRLAEDPDFPHPGLLDPVGVSPRINLNCNYSLSTL